MPKLLFGVKLTRLLSFIVVLFAPVAQTQAQNATPNATAAAIIESGKFRLHKFMQPIGEETYEISRAGDSLVVKSNFKFTDRGTPVPLTATLRTNLELTPEAFEIKGNTSRYSTIDEAIQINSSAATIRKGAETRQATVPSRFFTVAGYAPVAIQQTMMRYLMQNKIKAPLPTLPRGEVTIVKRGTDNIKIGNRLVELVRYSVSGVIRGRETLWLDEQQKLVALVGVDAEFDHFEAVREGYESALPTFVERAASDGMAVLAESSNRVSPPRKGALFITNANLIDGTGKTPSSNTVIVIENGKIKFVGSGVTVKIPKGANVFDAKGKYILPGLWDMHAHFTQVEGGPAYLAAGITTVRDVGNEFEFITAVRNAIKQGRGLGPRILLAGIIDGDSPAAIGIIRANTPEEARQVVNRYHDAGFQQIKIYDSVKLDILKEITREAHRLGMTVTGHVPNGMNAIQAVEAGMDHINHIRFLSPVLLPKGFVRQPEVVPAIDFNSPEAQQTLQFFKDHNTVIDPTMAFYEQLLLDGSAGVPPEVAAIRRASWGYFLNITRAIHQAGLTIVAGTDQAPGGSLHHELELYVQVGFTPMQAIQAATIVSARVMKMDQDSGTVEVGKNADLILIEGNPLDNISNLRNTKFVVTSGRMYDCAQLWQSISVKP